jgi:Pentapeptide repeats (8 copies)
MMKDKLSDYNSAEKIYKLFFIWAESNYKLSQFQLQLDSFSYRIRLARTKLIRAILARAKLIRAILARAKLKRAILARAKLKRAILARAKLSPAFLCITTLNFAVTKRNWLPLTHQSNTKKPTNYFSHEISRFLFLNFQETKGKLLLCSAKRMNCKCGSIHRNI